MDVMMALRPRADALQLVCEKMKDGPDFDAILLTLETVGDSVVMVDGALAEMKRVLKLDWKECTALAALTQIATPDGVPTAQWIKNAGLTAASFHRAIHRAAARLVERGYVSKQGSRRLTRYTLVKGSETALAINCQKTINDVGQKAHSLLSTTRPPLRGRGEASVDANNDTTDYEDDPLLVFAA